MMLLLVTTPVLAGDPVDGNDRPKYNVADLSLDDIYANMISARDPIVETFWREIWEWYISLYNLSEYTSTGDH